MSNLSGRLRAAIGALGIIALASPAAAQTHSHGGRMRMAAQWVERGHRAARQDVRWRRAAQWRMAGMGWRTGYAVGFGWRGPGYRRPVIRSGVGVRFVRPRRVVVRRSWHRGWAGWRYGVG
jgi:hypothetical protein